MTPPARFRWLKLALLTLACVAVACAPAESGPGPVVETAHQALGSEAADWNKLAGSGATLVIYMPGRDYSPVVAKLKAAGVKDSTPCAVISRATTLEQRTHRTTIERLEGAPRFAAPSLLVVGEVVRFADPVTLAQDFTLPVSIERGSELLTALFADFPSPLTHLTANEEPAA